MTWESEETPINLDPRENHRIVQRTIAKQLHRIHGDKAYMLVLIEMEADITPQKRENWREILNFLEQLERNGEIE